MDASRIKNQRSQLQKNLNWKFLNIYTIQEMCERSLLISTGKSNCILQFSISYTKPFALTYIYVKLSGIADI
ncbi:hypothetical protein [aff. Roholtiella sp. LEGE 12411]|uniref:hypothetical protein n=1 Tax=aff. Roholtiella sp. LEGE 12411 TaxID=1828822 RepID=UPI001882D242|nr:hypothetical protein [aff. Roholtiella sp. LEGE 12411]MBE9036001.1 hypothetical protein [aff. Roholtiella sp. LEGE 12411]